MDNNVVKFSDRFPPCALTHYELVVTIEREDIKSWFTEEDSQATDNTLDLGVRRLIMEVFFLCVCVSVSVCLFPLLPFSPS